MLESIAGLRKDLTESRELEQSLRDAGDWSRFFAQTRTSEQIAKKLKPHLAQVDQYEFRVATALWADKTFPFSAAYLKTIRRHYRTDAAFAVDFKRDPDGERQKINAWVEQQTNNRIRDLMSSDSIDPLTRVVLANAVYFKGEWAEPFEESATEKAIFTGSKGAKIKTLMMHNDGLKGALRGLQRRRPLLRHPAYDIERRA